MRGPSLGTITIFRLRWRDTISYIQTCCRVFIKDAMDQGQFWLEEGNDP